jgi:hypothetical protein
MTERLVRRHLTVGWWSLLVFLALGALLEGLNGFKVDWYVGAASQTRRHLWTLAHAHGTLIGLVHLAYAATARAVPALDGRRAELASRALIAAGVLLPLGFFSGGTRVYGGDPGLGVALVPCGAGALALAVALTAYDVTRALRGDGSSRE